MGSYYSTQNWYVYSRDLKSDSWNPKPIYEHTEAKMGLFKHLVFKFALQNSPSDKEYKALYLYHGSDRLCKAFLKRPLADNYFCLEMEFKNDIIANDWDLCEEEIIDQRLLWREIEFNKHYVSLPEDARYKRRWQLVKPLDNPDKSPNKKLSITEYIQWSSQINEQV
jgi:hypothetical protein